MSDDIDISDADMDFLYRHTLVLLKAEYNCFHEVSDGMLKLIDKIASLYETNYMTFDYEFKKICWVWEITHQ